MGRCLFLSLDFPCRTMDRQGFLLSWPTFSRAVFLVTWILSPLELNLGMGRCNPIKDVCMRKIALLIAALLAASAFGRVGPVSQYGQLMAGKNSSNKGQIYGSCKGISDGNEVAVQGMSLFWSISSDVGSPFWTADIVNGLVQNQNIQIVRAPMGVDEDWGSGNYFSKEGYYQGLMNTVVQAAIDNDIYVIVDYHSHKASDNLDNARKFFGYMAQKWGGYDNVIFEVFNEPTTQSWGTIKNYADSVVKTIRQYSDNLILVGSRSWDQYPSDAIGNEVSDPKKNVAYTLVLMRHQNLYM